MTTLQEIQDRLAQLEEMVTDSEQPCPGILMELAAIRSQFARVTEYLLLSGLRGDLARSSMASGGDEPIAALRSWHGLMGRYLR